MVNEQCIVYNSNVNANTMAENTGSSGDRRESGDKKLGDTEIVADLGTLPEDDEVDDEKKIQFQN